MYTRMLFALLKLFLLFSFVVGSHAQYCISDWQCTEAFEECCDGNYCCNRAYNYFKLGVGAIVGIAIAILVCISGSIAACVCCCCKGNNRQPGRVIATTTTTTHMAGASGYPAQPTAGPPYQAYNQLPQQNPPISTQTAYQHQPAVNPDFNKTGFPGAYPGATQQAFPQQQTGHVPVSQYPPTSMPYPPSTSAPYPPTTAPPPYAPQ